MPGVVSRSLALSLSNRSSHRSALPPSQKPRLAKSTFRRTFGRCGRTPGRLRGASTDSAAGRRGLSSLRASSVKGRGRRQSHGAHRPDGISMQFHFSRTPEAGVRETGQRDCGPIRIGTFSTTHQVAPRDRMLVREKIGSPLAPPNSRFPIEPSAPERVSPADGPCGSPHRIS